MLARLKIVNNPFKSIFLGEEDLLVLDGYDHCVKSRLTPYLLINPSHHHDKVIEDKVCVVAA